MAIAVFPLFPGSGYPMFRVSVGRGLLSLGSSLVFERGVAFLSNVVLARLLLPEDFGLITLALTVTEAVGLLGNFGVNLGLIYEAQETSEYATAAFWLSMGIGIVLAGLQTLLSGWTATFYHAADLQPVLIAFAVGYLITAVGSVPGTLLTKNLRFRSVAIVSIASTLVNTLLSIGLAVIGLGVWSLVVGRLGGQCITALLNYRLSCWRPSGWAESRHYRGLILYGRSVLVSDGLAYLNHSADYLILGKWAGTTVLGLYAIAYTLAMLPVSTIVLVIGRVTFPIFAQLQESQEDMQAAFELALRISAVAGIPILVGLFVLAEELVVVLYGAKWQQSIVLLRLLIVYALGRLVSSHGGNVMNAVGRPDIPMKFNLLYTPIFLLGLVTSAQFGAVGVAAATALISGVAAWIYLLLSLRVMRWPPRMVARGIGPACLAAGIMGFGIFLGRQVIGNAAAPALSLAILVPVGGILYGSMLSRFYPTWFQIQTLKQYCTTFANYRKPSFNIDDLGKK